MGWLPWDQDFSGIADSILGGLGLLVAVIFLFVIALLILKGSIPVAKPFGGVLIIVALFLVMTMTGVVSIPKFMVVLG